MATGSGSLGPQVGTAFPPKRNFIVTSRFATYKVGRFVKRWGLLPHRGEAQESENGEERGGHELMIREFRAAG